MYPPARALGIAMLYCVIVLLLILAAFVALGFARSPDHSSRARAAACLSVPLAVVVDLNNDRQAPVIDHERDAVRAGQPRILHLNRVDADAHRVASLRGSPVRSGFDRDEYPPAASEEGGAGADVRYISPRANRSAGATMRAQLEPFCDGQAFILEP